MNRVLRPACYSDVPAWHGEDLFYPDMDTAEMMESIRYLQMRKELKDLYDAEWRKRGFLRSP